MHAGKGLRTDGRTVPMPHILLSGSLEQWDCHERISKRWFWVRTVLGILALIVGLVWLYEGYRINDLNHGGWFPVALFTALYAAFAAALVFGLWRKQVKSASNLLMNL